MGAIRNAVYRVFGRRASKEPHDAGSVEVAVRPPVSVTPVLRGPFVGAAPAAYDRTRAMEIGIKRANQKLFDVLEARRAEEKRQENTASKQSG